MDNSIIGVIVPVYKVEKYIAECIESILAQTYTNFRLILVDDGTPDNAGKICDEYAKKDKRITVIHQKNAGVTRARARGVEEASDCKFITFVDSDDTITNDALEHLLSYMNNKTNIVLAKMSRYRYAIPKTTRKHKSKVISDKKHRINMILGMDSGPTAKLFRRELFSKNVYDIPKSIVMGEDTIANIRIAFNNTKNVVSTTKQIYNYRQHDNSIMHTFNKGVEYEELFMENLLSSIPKNKLRNYMKYIVIRKIRTFDYLFGYSTEVPAWRSNSFYNNLISEIKIYRIRELFIERQLITATNRNKRILLIFLKRVKNKIFGYETLI